MISPGRFAIGLRLSIGLCSGVLSAFWSSALRLIAGTSTSCSASLRPSIRAMAAHRTTAVCTIVGGVVSPILANLFLHYAFDLWMARSFPAIPFERYADDIICHCRSEEEAHTLWNALEVRFRTCGLVLHPTKTKLVYCKDTNRRGDYPAQSFDFLGYTFRPRKAAWRGGRYGTSFLPAASPDALKAIR